MNPTQTQHPDNAQHTPTPFDSWMLPLRYQFDETYGHCLWTKLDERAGSLNNFVVAECENEDDAKLLLRAVNSHAQLVAALEALLRNATDKARYISMLEGKDVEENEWPDEALDSPEMAQARAALASAQS